jgi:myo-inositol-1(or 4)-monophosphatase
MLVAPMSTVGDSVTDLDLLRDIVRAAGRIALDFFGGATESWDKNPGDPVSDADIAINDFLEDKLRAARPDYGWLSEESADSLDRRQSTRLWVVDPIDGTRAFLDGRQEYSISAAVVDSGRPVAGVVHNPSTGEFYEAAAAHGARDCSGSLKVTDRDRVDGAHILVSRSESRKRGWDGVFGDCRKTTISSVALKLARVAAGRADAMVSLWPKSDWDIVAGDLLVREAGGIVLTPAGEEIEYNLRRPDHPGIVAAGPGLIAPLLARLGEL